MRIVLDARSYFMRTGIARYTRGLVQALAANPGPHDWLLLLSDQHTPEEVAFPGEVRSSRAPWLGGDAERAVLAREAREFGADLFHAIFPPHALDGVRTLTTVFDLSPLTHPEVHQAVVRSAFAEAWASAEHDAHAFVAVSGATADQVRQRAGDGRPVFVVACGLSAPFDQYVGPNFSSGAASAGTEVPAYVPQEDANFSSGAACKGTDVPASARQGVLYVGTIEPRKNVGLLLAASRRLHDRNRRISVTLIGKRGWGFDTFEQELAATPDAAWLGYADDETLLGHYRRAALAACPSLLEGFGLPTLEAMAQGALPLVAPDPALIELVGRADLAVSLDPDAWADAIVRWLDDPAGRDAAAAATTARARRFTWPAIAEQMLPVYDAIR
jgi:glycosyltransferase involved in cell wall biosynthesis